MTFTPPSFNGPPSGRASIFAKARRPIASTVELVQAERERTSCRFRSTSAWRQVVALGSLLAGLAGVPVVSFVLYGVNGHYSPGMASIFGGLLQAMLIVRIGSPEIYRDWICVGILDVLIGLILMLDPSVTTSLSLVAFTTFLALSALVRIWIGVTLRHANAFTWIGSSGFVGLFLLVWFLVVLLASSDIPLDLPMASDLVLRADLTLRGVAIVGFGVSLKNREE